ncbi:MAG: trypsin-like peptidase domain-containing protein [Alphaproteobacteria bacterium]|nr:trypsin-like peptidase domain-containing protein [Alphaproteobacteria bacterium]
MRVFVIAFMALFLSKPVWAQVSSYADIVEEVMPSVVNISTEKEVNETQDSEIDNLMLAPDLKGRESLGSGFFISKNGHILTNYHVIKGAKKISVITNDGKTFEAKTAGVDTRSDLAVLKIDKGKTPFKAVVFGNADEARIGDIILAFGNPYGLGISVSSGIISAKSRNIGASGLAYLQTDAAINQGNSGGPMFNLDGEVIGVNSAVFASYGANGVGFSLPSNIAAWVATQLMDNGKVKRGWLGMSVANGIDQYTETPGFVITEINEESNAYKEGLRVGDIITKYNDLPADDLDAFYRFTEMLEPGQALRLKTLSFGEEIRNVIRIQEMPANVLNIVSHKALIENSKNAYTDEDDGVSYLPELNLAVKEATPRGLMIVKLEKKSLLYGKGIKEGDIILEANRNDIYTVNNLKDSLQEALLDEERSVSLLIQGTQNTFYTTFEPVAFDDKD